MVLVGWWLVDPCRGLAGEDLRACLRAGAESFSDSSTRACPTPGSSPRASSSRASTGPGTALSVRLLRQLHRRSSRRRRNPAAPVIRSPGVERT